MCLRVSIVQRNVKGQHFPENQTGVIAQSVKPHPGHVGLDKFNA